MTIEKEDREAHFSLRNLKDSVKEGVRAGILITVVAGIPLLGGMGYGIGYIVRDTEARAAARRASMVLYEPVGNGGALHEMYHGPTGDRERMYEKMSEVSRAVMGKR